jgi:uncharacterized membrane protein YqjE
MNNDNEQPSDRREHRDGGHDGGPIIGLLHSIKQLFATLLAMGQTRLELLTTELQSDIQRLAVTLFWSLAALFTLGIGCFMAALALIFIFWDTHRVLVSICVTTAFFGFALLAVIIVNKRLRNQPRLLQETLKELQRDQDSLQTRR